MVLARRLANLRSAGVLLVVLQCWPAPLEAQEKSKSDDQAELPMTYDLRDVVKLKEELVRLKKDSLKSHEIMMKMLEDAFNTAVEKRKHAQQNVLVMKQSPAPDRDLLEKAEDNAVLAEAEELARKEQLAAAMTAVESVKADCGASDADLAVSRAELKTEEEPGAQADEELQAANERFAVAEVKAASASQKLAENELKAAEADRAFAQKKLATAKRRVIKARNALKRLDFKDGIPKLGHLDSTFTRRASHIRVN